MPKSALPSPSALLLESLESELRKFAAEKSIQDTRGEGPEGAALFWRAVALHSLFQDVASSKEPAKRGRAKIPDAKSDAEFFTRTVTDALTILELRKRSKLTSDDAFAKRFSSDDAFVERLLRESGKAKLPEHLRTAGSSTLRRLLSLGRELEKRPPTLLGGKKEDYLTKGSKVVRGVGSRTVIGRRRPGRTLLTE